MNADPIHPRDEADAELEEAATQWFFRRDRGFASGEAAAFARWLGQDERHAIAIAEIEKCWAQFGQVRSIALPRTPPAPPVPANPSPWRAVLLASAAAIVVGGLAWLHFAPTRTPTINGAVVAREASRALTLPDGSTVQLSADSAIETHFTPGQRDVRLLRGEAHFTVAKNPARPFVVTAGAISVRAVGTAFNVRLRPESLEVLVTEGTVQLAPQAAPPVKSSPAAPRSAALTEKFTLASQPLVTVGEIAVIATPVESTEREVAVSQKRRLEFADASLAEIVADFNRFNAHKLIIDDPRLGARRFGATFPVGDYDSLVRLLESTAGVVAERRANETVLRLR